MGRPMRKRYGVPPLIVAATLVSLALTDVPSFAVSKPSMDSADLDEIVAGNTQFAFGLYSVLRQTQADYDGNLFFSPYSISAALAMTYTGARQRTETEMASVLHIPSIASPGEEPQGERTSVYWNRDHVAAGFGALEKSLKADPETDGYELHVANRLWGNEGEAYLDEFLKRLETHFGAGMERVSFGKDPEGARLTINSWVEDQTKTRIKDLIPSGVLDGLTSLVLTNAIYFKGQWASRFDATGTTDDVFRGEGGETRVAMMRQHGNFGYAETDGAQILDMPYKGGDVSMVVLLPREERPGGLVGLEKELTLEKLGAWMGTLSEREVVVQFPKFKMTWGTTDIAKHLKALGMREAFGGAADFSGINGIKDLFISNVFHKAFIEVNEEGTEAAAATAVVLKRETARPPVFRADRPFLFWIRDNVTGSILFVGRVANPPA